MTTTTDASAAARLAALADRADLEDLAARLGRWLDGGAQGDPGELFTEDVAVATPGGRAAGIGPIAAQARRNHGMPTQHLIAGVLSRVEGDLAHVSANLVAVFVHGDEPGDHRARGGVYDLDARRTGEGWRIQALTVTPLWREASPASRGGGGPGAGSS